MLVAVIPASAERLLHLLHAAGFEAYLVGGSVRDILRGIPPQDFDMTTSATPDEMRSVFSGFRVIETGIKHGTITVISGGIPYEITTYRVDGAYSDGRHPDSVSFTRSLREDLARRDFTVNAMAYLPDVGVVDPFGGQADLEAHRLRAVGNPYRRFEEDALRILRALRFSSCLGFEIEGETERAALALAPRLSLVSPERRRVELEKLLLGEGAGRILLRYGAIISAAMPEFAAVAPEIGRLAEGIDRLEAAPHLRWSALLSPLGEQGAGDALRALRYDSKTLRRVEAAVSAGGAALADDRRALLFAFSRFGQEAVLDRLAIAVAAREKNAERIFASARALVEAGVCCKIADLAVSGDDLLQCGIPPGREIGEALALLLSLVIEGKINNRKEDLLGAIEGARKNHE